MQATGNNLQESETIQPFIKLRNGESEDIHYSLFYESIPEEFKDVALKELNETEENKLRGLLKLKDFLKGKSIYGIEDYTLQTVLRSYKYDIKKSENKLLKYLEFLDMLIKRLQATADFDRLETVLKSKAVGFLPYRDKQGRMIVYTTPYNIDLKLFDMDDAALCAFCLVAYALSFPLSTVVGFTYIGEGQTPNLSITYTTMKALRYHIPAVLANPVRVAKIDVINENVVIRWSYNLLKHLLPSKLVQRVTFHGSNIQGLQKFYHPAILPVEFGGTLGPMNPDAYIESFLNFVKKLKSKKLYLSDA